ncbi:MAG: C25 family cysteine peptidase [Caldisericia bacterium]
MKKLITFVVAVFVLVSVFPVFNLGAQENLPPIELPLSPGDFTLTTSNLPAIPVHFELNPEKLITFQGKLFYEGMGLTQDFGYPQIPVVTKRIHLENKNPVSISIESVDWEIRSIPELEKYRPKTWGMKQIDYPETNWEGMYPGKLGEYNIEEGSDGNWLSLLFAPISLDFEKNEMIVFSSIDLKINYQIDFSLFSTTEEDEIEKSVILCPDLLRSAAESLAVIQREDGYEVEVVTVSSIASRYSPQDKEPENMSGYEDMSKSERKFLEAYDYDLAKKIRSYFESEIDEIDYVTLMGDGELIPASFYSIGGWSDYEFDRYIPTDLFYASPDLDTIPNFALGRLPVRNIDEANVVVEKIKNYREALKEEDWFHKINLGGGDPFNGGFEGEIDCQALIDMGMLDGFEVNKYYKTRERFGSKDMIEALSDEVGFVYTVSHGSGEALITEPGEVTTEDVLNLPKRGKLPILLSPACINGMYDSTIVNHKLNEYEVETVFHSARHISHHPAANCIFWWLKNQLRPV